MLRWPSKEKTSTKDCFSGAWIYKLRGFANPETKKRMAVDPTIETAPNVVILDASRARRGFAISWIVQTLVTAALIGICLHAEVVAYVARYASQQEISKLITIVSPVMAQQTPLPKDDEAVQLKQAVDSATAALAQSLQQEHDRAEALATELAKVRQAVEQKPAPDRSATGSIKPGEPARVEQNRAGASAASTSGPTIQHPEPAWAMTDDGVPAHK